MKNLFRSVSATLALVTLAVLSGCSSGSPAAPAISVVIAPATGAAAAMVGGATQNFTATVANDGTTTPGVTWAISSGGGSLTNVTATSVTYTAANPVTTSAAVIIATSKTDVSKSASVSITLTPIGVSITTVPVAMVAGATQTFAASVTGDTTLNQGVTWSANVGSITSGGVYTAPTPIATATATITATSKTDTTKTGSVNVTLTPVAVTISPLSPTAMVAGGTQAFTATVTGDPASAGVKWSAPSGAFSSGTSAVLSGVASTYTAASPVSGASVVLTATSVSDTTKTATVSVTLTPVATPVITATGTSGAINLGVSQTQAFTAAIATGDSTATPGVNWSISSGGGTLTSSSSTGVTYNAPTTVISAASTATLVATSRTDSSKTASVVINLQPIAVAAVTPATASLAGAATQTFGGAAVTYDGTNSGVTWSVSPSTGAGTINSSGLYTAPTVVGSTTSATITATSVKDPTKSGTVATVTLLPVAVSFTTTTYTIDSQQQLSIPIANVSNDSSNAGVTYSTTAGSVAPPSLGNFVFTAPTVTSGQTVVTITATSVKDISKTATVTVTVNPALAFTTPSSQTATLTAGQTNTAYSYQVVVGGGTGTKTFTLVSGAFPAGITMSSTGLISGTPTTVTAGATAGVRVTDGSSNPSVLNGSFTIAVSAAPLVFNTPTLNVGTVAATYSQQLTASGGTGTLTYTVNTGTLPAGMSLSASGLLTGPATADTAVAGTPLTFKVTDSATPTPATQITGTVNLVVNPKPLAVTTTTLPGGTAGVAYSYQLLSTGGTGAVTWTKTAGTLPSPLTLSAGGLISGTVTSATTASGLAFQVTDTPDNGRTAQTASVSALSLTIAASATGSLSGNVGLAISCQGVATPPVTMTLNTTPTPTTTTTSNGSFSLTNVPNGTYTLTPSVAGASTVFYPATQSVVVNSGTGTANFSASIGFNVSGTVAYTGSKTGRIYVYLSPTTCSGNSVAGTSISAAGTFTIHGVQPGTYTLNAYMDNVGQGVQNISNPTGSTGSVVVSAANVTGSNVTLSDPSVPSITSASPSIQGVFPMNTAAVIAYSPISSSNIETAASYTLQWSTSSTFATITGSKTFPATGTNGTNVWLVNGLTNGTAYYFRAYGTNSTTTQSAYGIYVGSGSTAAPVTINATTGGVAVSGSVTFTGTATGPLYAGYFSGQAFYGQYFSSPASAQAFTINLPAGTYQAVAILDQNNNGYVDAGDLSNTSGNSGTVTFTGATTGQSITLPSGNTTSTVVTQYSKTVTGSNVNTSYSLEFNVRGNIKLPVAAAIVSATNPNVMVTQDIGVCTSCGGKEFDFSANITSAVPVVADSYGLQLTYSDGTTETVNPAVTAVLGASALATSLTPQTGTNLTPTFTWVYPASPPSNATYSFSICCGTNGNIWQVPGSNSNSNGFTSAQIPGASITWNVDPTDSSNSGTASPSSLSHGTFYNWQLQTQDANKNSATVSVSYQP